MPEETLEGYVVDIACLRKYPRAEWAERARRHSQECALMGHGVESGFALVGDDGAVALLDAASTPRVLAAVQGSGRKVGLRLRARREPQEGEMVTVAVEEVA